MRKKRRVKICSDFKEASNNCSTFWDGGFHFLTSCQTFKGDRTLPTDRGLGSTRDVATSEQGYSFLAFLTATEIAFTTVGTYNRPCEKSICAILVFGDTPSACWSAPDSGSSHASYGATDSTCPQKISDEAVDAPFLFLLTGPISLFHRPDVRRRVYRRRGDHFADACCREG